MVRVESVVISVYGASLGLVLGSVLGVALWPARRAGRLQTLTAIATPEGRRQVGPLVSVGAGPAVAGCTKRQATEAQ